MNRPLMLLLFLISILLCLSGCQVPQEQVLPSVVNTDEIIDLLDLRNKPADFPDLYLAPPTADFEYEAAGLTQTGYERLTQEQADIAISACTTVAATLFDMRWNDAALGTQQSSLLALSDSAFRDQWHASGFYESQIEAVRKYQVSLMPYSIIALPNQAAMRLQTETGESLYRVWAQIYYRASTKRQAYFNVTSGKTLGDNMAELYLYLKFDGDGQPSCRVAGLSANFFAPLSPDLYVDIFSSGFSLSQESLQEDYAVRLGEYLGEKEIPKEDMPLIREMVSGFLHVLYAQDTGNYIEYDAFDSLEQFVTPRLWEVLYGLQDKSLLTDYRTAIFRSNAHMSFVTPIFSGKHDPLNTEYPWPFKTESYQHADSGATVYLYNTDWQGRLEADDDFGERMGMLRCVEPNGWYEYRTHIYFVQQEGRYLIDGFRTYTISPGEQTRDPYDTDGG